MISLKRCHNHVRGDNNTLARYCAYVTEFQPKARNSVVSRPAGVENPFKKRVISIWFISFAVSPAGWGLPVSGLWARGAWDTAPAYPYAHRHKSLPRIPADRG